jgi:biopolymer transport protein ExbD
MRVRKGERRRARIEMIPLIDVTFLLLVFFIYISLSMTIHRGVPLMLPKAQSARMTRVVELEVSIDADGQIYVDEAPVELDRLQETLRQAAAGREVEQVSLRGDQRVAYQRIMDVLDRIRRAGLGKVTLEASGEP